MSHPSRPAERLHAIDAMRGIASLLVVFFHLQGAFARAPQPWMNETLARVFSAGHYGVNIFFVLSGFVIAYSLRTTALSWGFLGRFTARRSVRLDIPLWCAIGAEFVLVWLSLRYFPDRVQAQLPTVPQLLANAVYLQEFLGFAHVSPVFWTLCFEIQFYLTLVFLLVAEHQLSASTTAAVGRNSLQVVLLGLFGASIAARLGVVQVPQGLALERWNEFFLGALAYWAIAGKLPRWSVFAAALTILAAAWVRHDVAEAVFTIVTASVCAACLTWPVLNRSADRPLLQGLGRISYSTYLVHGSVGYRTVSFGQYLWGASLTGTTGPLLWVLSMGAAILAAWCFHWLFERPALALSRRIPLTPGHQ